MTQQLNVLIKASDIRTVTLSHIKTGDRPRGKESAEVRITQKIGKERGNSYQKMKRSPAERRTQTHGRLTETPR